MKEETAKAVACSIELYLNPTVFSDPNNIRSINEALGAGRPVVIRNALQEAFAERVFQGLDRASGWRLHERYEESFHFHHHNLSEKEKELYPPELSWCKTVFTSESTKNFMQGLSHGTVQESRIFPQAGTYPAIIRFLTMTITTMGKVDSGNWLSSGT